MANIGEEQDDVIVEVPEQEPVEQPQVEQPEEVPVND